METVYKAEFNVASTDIDAFNQARPSAVLAWLQHYGTAHSTLLNIDRQYLVDNYNACWILARVWYRMTRPLAEGEQLKLMTWCRTGNSLTVYRDYNLYCGEECVGEAVAAWVIADVESRNLLRTGTIRNLALYQAPECVKDKQLKLIRTPKERQPCFNRTIRLSDLDINNHMNNTRYADVIMDAFSPDQLNGRFITEFQLNYSQECKYGTEIEVSRAVIDDRSWYVDGCCEDGKRRFEAVIKLSEVHDI